MSFDRSPQRQQEPSDLPPSTSPSHNDHRLPPASSFGLRPLSGPAPASAPVAAPTTTAAPVKMEERDGPSSTSAGGSHYGGPSLPPPSAMHPHQHNHHPHSHPHSHPHPHYPEYKTEYKTEYSRPPSATTAASSSSLPFASSSPSSAPIWDYSDRNSYAPADQQPLPQYQARDYPRAHNLPSLAADISPAPYARQPTTSAFDPIRSSQAAEPVIRPKPEPVHVKAEPVPIAPQQPASQPHPQPPQQPPQSSTFHADRAPSTASPIMSISQLLSSDTPSQNAPPPASRLRYAETIDHPPPQPQPQPQTQTQLQHPPAHIAPAPVPAPASETAPPSAPPPQPFRNGIHSLLNNDEPTEDVYEMADSESDTEPASRLASASVSASASAPASASASASATQPQTSPPAPAAPRTFLPSVTELNGHAAPQKTPHEVSSDYYPSLPEQNGYDLSDDSSVEGNEDHQRKPLVRRTLDDLELSSDDEDIFTTHRDQMVQYMIHVYRRRQQVIDDYEEKRMHRHSLMNDQLQRIYEKRYGTEFSQTNQEPFSATTSMLLQAAREEKERSKRKQKRAKQRQRTQGYAEDDDDAATDLQLSQKSSKAPRKIEEERRQIWLNIARKDVPRMARIISRVQATRAGNCKKVAQYCQKEVKRAATNGGRLTRDVQLKAKKASKEMLVFWKKNEKEERELRKKAEKEALERLRLEEERRESQRQARKLNFLITQTELYSHFIGRKIKQGEGDDDEAAMPEPSPAGPDHVSEDADIDLEENGGEEHLGEIDFDEDDDEKLREQARRGAQNALAKQRERTRVFDEGARERRAAAESSDISMNAAQLDTMNFQDPSSMGTEEIKQPTMLMCQLKTYQLKGLNWLANLYEQGINGILADEMGLGKTVQSISLMAYLAEVHNIWGPFLVIAPSSTLHNWQQEISKFVPSFRALPYWGNPKDRKVLRQFWNRKQLYGRDAPFHVVITSYQLVLTDVSYFQRVKWQYMVLDEAQAIKSSSSARWKQLLGFHCRNRLLLTGTPIQNSMQELWALLHFIMPTLFDSHEEFSEWFSKDIESHAENKGTLNEHQLRRLHMILKPFMLRRIKRNVQHELGEKIEVEVFCDLTARQRALYRGLKEKISVSELLEKATSLGDTESMDSLMNLVMQFRKVCNHPELFERADVESPLSFCTSSETGSLSKETSLYCPYSSRSHIKYHIPKHLYRNGGILNVPGPHSNAGFTTHYLDNLMNIWSTDYIKESMYEEHNSAFSFLRFADTSPQEASALAKRPLVARWVSHLAQRDQRARRRFFEDNKAYASAPVHTYASMLVRESMPVPTPGSALEELMTVGERTDHLDVRVDKIYIPAAEAVPVDAFCADRSFESDQTEQLFDADVRACLFGRPQCATVPKEASDLKQIVRKADGQGLLPIPRSGQGYSHLRVPAMRDLILDSGKLATLDRLLEKLKTEGHRCLIYFQMTRMIDLMEEYIAYKQYKYLRLDGSSKISDRRDMVSDWQTRPEIFIFLLSTRAGGLGINLTAADTVIFYDSDWNPTVDQQAMDRAHRLGQTKQVTVYRLITKGTIEERILQRAKQKDEIQKVVISGGEFKQVDFKPREIVSLLLDDEEMDNKLQQQLKRKADEEEKKKSSRPVKRSKKNNQETVDMDKLMSAGGDVLPEDVENGGASSSSAAKRKARIGRPRTNISFTG